MRRRRGRANPSLARSSEGLDRGHLGFGLVVVLAMAIITAASVAAINGLPLSNPYELKAIVPADAPIVRDGDEVRVAGQRVGQVRGIDYTPEGRQIDMDIDDGKVSEDATVTVRLRGLAGAVFIDLTRGEGDAAPEGFTVPAAQTATGTQLTDVVAAFDSDTREGLSNGLNGFGGGSVGRGEGLNRMLAELPPTLVEGRDLLDALSGEPGDLSNLTASADRTFRGLYGERNGDVAGAISGGSRVLGATADSGEQLGEAIREAPATMAEVRRTLPLADPLLDDLTGATRELRPGIAALDRAMPSVNHLLARRTELGEISLLARTATPVLDLALPVIQGLEPSARTLGPLADALRPLAAYVGQYPEDVFAGPNGFTTWGGFHYNDGQAKGSRGVRFTPILTCQPGRNPYPAPGKAGEDREACAY